MGVDDEAAELGIAEKALVILGSSLAAVVGNEEVIAKGLQYQWTSRGLYLIRLNSTVDMLSTRGILL